LSPFTPTTENIRTLLATDIFYYEAVNHSTYAIDPTCQLCHSNYMKKNAPGFTLVELIIVTIVIGILASIIAVAYNGGQMRARNLKVQDGATKIADAIQLFIVNKGHFPAGGWGSTVAIGSATECPDGVNGWFGTSMYTCTVEDTLVASGYLPAGFTQDLPPNIAQSASDGLVSIAAYQLPSNDHGMVFYSVESPSASTTEHFNEELTECGIDPSGSVYQRDSLLLQDGICFEYHL